MRFYIPGTTKKANASDDEAEKGYEGYQEDLNAANVFYDTLMEKAEIGEVAGETFATFEDILHLTPRYDPTGLISPNVPTNMVQRPIWY